MKSMMEQALFQHRVLWAAKDMSRSGSPRNMIEIVSLVNWLRKAHYLN